MSKRWTIFLIVTFGAALVALTIAVVLFAADAAKAQTTKNDPFDLYVTVKVCQVELHPTGRVVSYSDSQQRSGTVSKPDTVTLDYPDGGWIDVSVNHIPGDEDSEPVTKRFEIPPCPPTPTTSTPTETTLPGSTTSSPSTTTTSSPTTSTTGSSSTTLPTPSTTVPESTTTTQTTTSSSTTTTPQVVTTTVISSPTTTQVETTTTSSVPPTTTTLPECTDEQIADGAENCTLPYTGIESTLIGLVGLGLVLLGVLALRAGRRAG